MGICDCEGNLGAANSPATYACKSHQARYQEHSSGLVCNMISPQEMHNA
jgi:hypothetical protein